MWETTKIVQLLLTKDDILEPKFQKKAPNFGQGHFVLEKLKIRKLYDPENGGGVCRESRWILLWKRLDHKGFKQMKSLPRSRNVNDGYSIIMKAIASRTSN